MNSLEQRVENIERRNRRVEFEKAWEVSIARKAAIAVLTYIVVSLFFLIIKVERPFVNAIVPSLGFLLSTLSLSFLKRLWINKQSKLPK